MDWERQPLLALAAHRFDEFPVDYSWRVALQENSLPLRQPRLILRVRSVEGKNFFDPVLVHLNCSHEWGASHFLMEFAK